MFLLGVLLFNNHKTEILHSIYSSSDGLCHDFCIGLIDWYVQWLLVFVYFLFLFLFEQIFFKLRPCLLRALTMNILQQVPQNIIKKEKEKQRLQYGFMLIYLCHTIVFGRTALTHHSVLFQIQNILSCLLAFLFNVPR